MIYPLGYDKLHHKYRGAINALAQANEDLDAIMGREEVWLKEKKALEEQIEQLKESKARLKEKKGELKANLREKREKKKVRVANAKAKRARRKTKGSATKA